MKPTKFSEHIGNIDDRLIQQAGAMPDFWRQRRNRSIRRIVSIAAVIALMTCSFVIGALAINKDPETIYVDVYVEVEKEQEIIKVGDSGISLILPDSWKDKYGYEYNDSQSSYDYIDVYHLATRESFEYGGVLFQIAWVEGLYPLDYSYPEPGFTIALTQTHTYRMIYPSDVQVDIHNPEAWAEYDALYADINNIEIVMTAETLANTMNKSNWVQGTVIVDFIENDMTVETVVCDEAQSQIIREVIGSQTYRQTKESFRYDLWIMVDSEQYRMSSTTGMIESSDEYPGNAVLSAEDLSRIMDALGG